MTSLEQAAKALAADLPLNNWQTDTGGLAIITKHMEAFAREQADMLRRENIKLRTEVAQNEKAISATVELLEEFNTENRELLKDKEHMDQLEQMKTDYQCTSGDWDWFVVLPHIREHESYGAIRTFSTLREALDKAALAKGSGFKWKCDDCGMGVDNPETLGTPFACPNCGEPLVATNAKGERGE